LFQEAHQKPILDKLNGTLDVALDNASVRKRLLDLGCDIPDKAQRGQETLAAQVKSEIARWGPIVKAANIKNEKGSGIASRFSFNEGPSARVRNSD
jgi:tripartite-type tricarboxylate transporter receptor subunit TctC